MLVLGLATADTAAVITAAATVALAALAYRQIRAGREQSEATLKIASETRQAAERQWQPRVIPHQWHGGARLGAGDVA